MERKQLAYVLFDIDGCTDIVPTRNLLCEAPAVSSRCKLKYGAKKLDVEILQLSDAKEDLLQFEAEWSGGRRSQALDCAKLERKSGGYLGICPDNEVISSKESLADQVKLVREQRRNGKSVLRTLKKKLKQVVCRKKDSYTVNKKSSCKRKIAGGAGCTLASKKKRSQPDPEKDTNIHNPGVEHHQNTQIVPQEDFPLERTGTNNRKVTVLYEGSGNYSPAVAVPQRWPVYLEELDDTQRDIVMTRLEEHRRNVRSTQVQTKPVLIFDDEDEVQEEFRKPSCTCLPGNRNTSIAWDLIVEDGELILIEDQGESSEKEQSDTVQGEETGDSYMPGDLQTEVVHNSTERFDLTSDYYMPWNSQLEEVRNNTEGSNWTDDCHMSWDSRTEVVHNNMEGSNWTDDYHMSWDSRTERVHNTEGSSWTDDYHKSWDSRTEGVYNNTEGSNWTDDYPMSWDSRTEEVHNTESCSLTDDNHMSYDCWTEVHNNTDVKEREGASEYFSYYDSQTDTTNMQQCEQWTSNNYIPSESHTEDVACSITACKSDDFTSPSQQVTTSDMVGDSEYYTAHRYDIKSDINQIQSTTTCTEHKNKSESVKTKSEVNSKDQTCQRPFLPSVNSSTTYNNDGSNKCLSKTPMKTISCSDLSLLSESQGSCSFHEIDTADDMASVLPHTEVRVSRSMQQIVKSQSSSAGNFAWSLTQTVYRDDELEGRNCHGRRGKQRLSPRRLKAVYQALRDTYGENSVNDVDITDAINQGLRNKFRKSVKRNPLSILFTN